MGSGLQESSSDGETTPTKKEGEGTATPWALLDVKSMKVADLRAELEARGLDIKGVKAVLGTRLQEALDAEMAADEEAEKKEEEKKAAEEAKAKEAESAKSDASDGKSEKEKAKAKEKEDKEKKEKKAALERHFGLSSLEKASPGLLVYPNRTAKAGKFDCKLMSLASLLDYRVEDSKEHSFEVSLFAEMFAEMLHRDSSFRVFKSILAAPEKESADKKKDESKESSKEPKEGEEKKEEGKTEEKMDTTTNGTTESDSKEEAAKEETKKEEPKKDEPAKDSASPKKEDSKKRKRSKSPDKKEEKVILVKDPGLLLAYSVFDHNLCGYLYERDLEEILHFPALGLSRAQVQRLLKRLHSRGDSINYRRLTDTLAAEGSLEVRSHPNLAQLPPDQELIAPGGPLGALGEEARDKTDEGREKTAPVDVGQSGGQVYFEGSLVDVGQLLGQLRRMESEQRAMEARNAAMEKEVRGTKDQLKDVEKKKRRLEDDCSSYKKRMYDAEKCLKTSSDDAVLLKTTLNDVKKAADRISIAVDKALPIPKEEKKEKKEKKKAEEEKKEEKKETKDEDEELTVKVPIFSHHSMRLEEESLVFQDSITEEEEDAPAEETTAAAVEATETKPVEETPAATTAASTLSL